MKIIVTGATGKAGIEAARACMWADEITQVYLLTRKPVAEDLEKSDKTQVIMVDDFERLDEKAWLKMRGAQACLWAIGGSVEQFNHDEALCRKVNVDLTVSTAEKMKEHLAPHAPSGPFRFVFLSGQYSEWNQDKKLHFLSASRKIKGEAERLLLELAEERTLKSPEDLTESLKNESNEGRAFDVMIVKPTGLRDDHDGIKKKIIASDALGFGIHTRLVGKAMKECALYGSKKKILENNDLRTPVGPVKNIVVPAGGVAG